VQGPITQCQLVETAILNAVNYETLIATKAARICEAAKAPVAEFGLRRAHGPAGGVYASRAAIVGGCSSTSNVEAGRLFGLPVSGTHAHSWVMAFESELEAFRAFAAAFPHNCTLLVDTYDVMAGVDNAIIVALEMAARGEQLSAIRIDSGDLAWLSKRARAKLDDAGLHGVRIVASNDLDEFTINSLLHEQDAAIDAWGVGTKLVTAAGQASLGGVYKMCALREAGEERWQPRMKLSAQLRKSTLPGMLSLRRYFDNNGVMAGDMVYSADEQAGTDRIIDPFDDLRQKDLGACSHEELLLPLVRAGEPVGEPLGALAAQARAKASLDALDPSNKRLLNPHSYPVGLSIPLHQLRASLIKRFRGLA
jgi:nicotinate phosphoribosyltransferase